MWASQGLLVCSAYPWPVASANVRSAGGRLGGGGMKRALSVPTGLLSVDMAIGSDDDDDFGGGGGGDDDDDDVRSVRARATCAGSRQHDSACARTRGV